MSIENEAEQGFFYESNIRSAFDLASGGMGIHLHAVSDLTSGKPLESWGKGSVRHYSCNYLVTPYVQIWTGNLDNSYSSGPLSLSPFSEDHLRLINASKGLYKKINEKRLRLVLASNESATQSDLDRPLTLEELNGELLPMARDSGLIVYDESFKLTKIPYSVGGLFGEMYRAGVHINDEFDNRMDNVDENPVLDNEISAASIYKLGAMLAVTDQFTYDAFQQGMTIPADFRPPDLSGNWSAKWQRLFNKEFPTIEELYDQAFVVFKASADPNDPIIQYLFTNLEKLPHLGR